ncbi:hypothetical protein [Moraxella lacunata]|uniref:hypothetical protein n=1 Tax=Moraxella lacunata TaxID=477 RepID=UPI003EDF7B24
MANQRWSKPNLACCLLAIFLAIFLKNCNKKLDILSYCCIMSDQLGTWRNW